MWGRKVGFLAKKFDIDVFSKWCKGCGLCIAICPKKVLELSDQAKSVPVRPDDCIGGRQCENVCPDMAITIKERD